MHEAKPCVSRFRVKGDSALELDISISLTVMTKFVFSEILYQGN